MQTRCCEFFRKNFFSRSIAGIATTRSPWGACRTGRIRQLDTAAIASVVIEAGTSIDCSLF
ncbi:hypothetical protein [Oxynema aestuarii]|uniref:hypothetical protein n=1 Tax=Oxynema aestuarii TaxID=2874213 RepID=UPI001B31858B|nr:hypothetical protein [Oxynema aestuarii]